MPMTWVRITALDCTKVWFTTGGSKVFGLALLWRILTKYTSTKFESFVKVMKLFFITNCSFVRHQKMFRAFQTVLKNVEKNSKTFLSVLWNFDKVS